MKERRAKAKQIIYCIIAWILPFGWGAQAKAEELVFQQQSTNIVAVVDCSQSMQVSDPDWKVPEALQMLVDMCPDSDRIRLSLILYGTETGIIFRDMPLYEENRENLKEKIQDAIMVEAKYALGQTDTGAALDLARKILKEQAGQNNMVLLFTDGVVLANKNGRTTQMSLEEIDAFAVFAQNNGIVVNTLGLFRTGTDEAQIRQAERELAALKSKTGGVYQRVENAGDIPDFVISLLAATLDVRKLSVSAAEGIQDEEQQWSQKQLWLYEFAVEDVYADDVTLIIPNPRTRIGQVYLRNRTAESGYIPIEEWDGAECVSYRRYNGTQGYFVLHLPRQEFGWIGEYELGVEAEDGTAPEIAAFFLYDVNLHIGLDEENAGVLKPLEIEVYLTAGDGYRIDDADFLGSLNVQLNIVNLENMSMETDRQATGEEKSAEGDIVTEEMQLYNDSFRFIFVPERVTDYQISVKVWNDYFVRQGDTQPLEVSDRLKLESGMLTVSPQKNDPLEIQAYLVQEDTHEKIRDAEFYRLAGMILHLKNLETGVEEDVEMQTLEDGSGVQGFFTPLEAGEYEAVVRTESRRENIVRYGEQQNFVIVDHPIERRGMRKYTGGFLYSYFKGFSEGEQLIFRGDDYFWDPDEDSFRVGYKLISGAGLVNKYDHDIYYQTNRAEDFQMELIGSDYSGNRVSVMLEFRILSENEKILITIAMAFIGIFLAGLVIYVLRCWWVSRNEMKGIIVMDVSLNGNVLVEASGKKPDGYPRANIGRFYIPLVNQQGVEDERDLLKKPQTFISRISSRRIEIKRLLGIYAECYAAGGMEEDSVYRYLKSCAMDEKIECALFGQDRGRAFSIKNVRKGASGDNAFILSRKIKNLRECIIYQPVINGVRNSNFAETNSYCVCGLEISLVYIPNRSIGKK